MGSDFWQIVLAVALLGLVVGIFVVLPIIYMITGPHFRHDDGGPAVVLAVVPTLMTVSLTTTKLMNQSQAATTSLVKMLHGPEQRTDTPEETLEESEGLRRLWAYPVPAELPPNPEPLS